MYQEVTLTRINGSIRWRKRGQCDKERTLEEKSGRADSARIGRALWGLTTIQGEKDMKRGGLSGGENLAQVRSSG